LYLLYPKKVKIDSLIFYKCNVMLKIIECYVKNNRRFVLCCKVIILQQLKMLIEKMICNWLAVR